MKENRVKRVLNEGGFAVGTMITEFRTAEVARMLAAVGFDFAVIDSEHSPYNLETIADIIRAGKASDLTCLVRVADAEYHLIARTLDAGAQGVVVPRVEEKDVVAKVVSAGRYPPLGERGYGLRGLVTDYAKLSVKDLMQRVDADTMLIIQIESVKAVDDVEDLISVKGLDGVLIGPNDLSISLGIPGELNHPKIEQAIQKVVNACVKYDVARGIHLRDLEHLLKWKQRGINMLLYSTDVGLLMSAASPALKQLKG